MRKPTASGALFPLVLVASAVMVIAGVWVSLNDAMAERRLVGCVLLGAGILCAGGSALVYGVFVQLRHFRDEAVKAQEQTLATLTERLGAISVMLNVVSEQQLLSDRAKAVAYREKDRETLRRAIREELGRNDWEAARVLVEEMEATFGYRAEADGFRAEIDAHRADGLRSEMRAALHRVDRLCAVEDWAGAAKEAKQFVAAFPDFEPASRMPAEVEARRLAYKQQLLDRWNDAVLRHDGDAGIAILKKLDLYLTPAEGERMAESARSIFNDRKQKLRDQFGDALAHGLTYEAVRVGEQIMKEFPNSQMALELRDAMDGLRERAKEEAEAGRGPREASIA
jgi:hypothetical protein